eukprot:5174506-Pleurochrysis_carterae.AAC.1
MPTMLLRPMTTASLPRTCARRTQRERAAREVSVKHLSAWLTTRLGAELGAGLGAGLGAEVSAEVSARRSARAGA